MAIEDHLIDPFLLELDRRAAPFNASQPQAAGASSGTGLPSAAGDNTFTVSKIVHQLFGINNASGFTGTFQPFDISLASGFTGTFQPFDISLASGLVIGAQPLVTDNSNSVAIATAALNLLDTPNSDVPIQSNSAAIAQSLSDNSLSPKHANFTDAANASDAPLNTSGPNVTATVPIALHANAQALAAPVSTQRNTQPATTGRRRGPYLKGNQSRLGQVKLPAGYVPINGDNHNGIWQCPINGCDLQQNPPTTKFSMLRHYARDHPQDAGLSQPIDLNKDEVARRKARQQGASAVTGTQHNSSSHTVSKRKRAAPSNTDSEPNVSKKAKAMNPREASPAASDSIEQAVNDALESNDSNLVNDLLQASELNRFANVPLQLNAPQGPPRYQSRPMFPPRRTAAPRPNVPVPQNVSTSVPQNIQATQNIAPSAQNAASAQTDQPQENGMVPPPQEPRRPQPAQAVVNDFIAIRAFLIRQGFFYRLDGGRIGLVVHHSDLRRQTGPGIEHHVLQAVRIYLHLVQGFDLPDLDTLYIGPQLDMDRNGRTFVVSEDFVASTRAAFAIIGVYNVEDCPFGGRNSFGSYAEQEQAALNWLRSVTRRQLCMSDLATE